MALVNNGNIEVLKGFSLSMAEIIFVFEKALYRGNEHIVKWILSKSRHVDIMLTDNIYTMFAARADNLAMLRVLVEASCAWNYELIAEKAVLNGNLNMLQYVYNRRILRSNSINNTAAFKGHKHILKWTRYFIPWTHETSAFCAFGGHFKLLKWLRRKGCPWSDLTSLAAFQSGQYEILDWALKHGCQTGSPKAVLGLTFLKP